MYDLNINSKMWVYNSFAPLYILSGITGVALCNVFKFHENDSPVFMKLHTRDGKYLSALRRIYYLSKLSRCFYFQFKSSYIIQYSARLRFDGHLRGIAQISDKNNEYIFI